MHNSQVGLREFRFACTQCGACCRWEGEVRLADQDVDRLAAHLKMSPDSLLRDYVTLAKSRRQLALIDQPGGACVFLQGNQCSVYPARPQQCRSFPFPHTTPSNCPGLTFA